MQYIQLILSLLKLLNELTNWLKQVKQDQANEWVVSLTDTIVFLKDAKTSDERKAAAKRLQNLIGDL